MKLLIGAAAIAISLSSVPARSAVNFQDAMSGSSGVVAQAKWKAHKHARQTIRKGRHIRRSVRHHVVYRTARTRGRAVGGATVAYLSHPSGCPGRAFCGCGAAVEVFGSPVRRLWLARNWYAFPRSVPGPMRVGVRPHHVVVLREPRGGNMWLVASYNSGGHQSRLQVINIASYTVVDPRGSRYASLR